MATMVTGYTVWWESPGADDVESALLDAKTISVEYAGRGRWAVRCRGRCLTRSARDWVWEPTPSERTYYWLKTHRFDDVDVALRHAERWAKRFAAGENP